MQVGPRKPGVVYPGEEKVKVVLDPGNIACLNGIDNDARCAVIIKEGGVYRVKIAINNEVGQTNFIFQCKCLTNKNLTQNNKPYALQHIHIYTEEHSC